MWLDLKPNPLLTRFYFLIFQHLRIIATTMAALKKGSHIHLNSESNTTTPRPLKKLFKANGDTLIGRQGKKYLVLSSGQNQATPRPPLVMASKKIWLTTAPLKTKNATQRLARSHGAKIKPITPSERANAKLCDAPRCPKTSPYAIPSLKPITSKSGKIAQNTAATSKRSEIILAPKARPAASTGAGWLKIVGIIILFNKRGQNQDWHLGHVGFSFVVLM